MLTVKHHESAMREMMITLFNDIEQDYKDGFPKYNSEQLHCLFKMYNENRLKAL